MKKKIFGGIAVLAIAAVAAWNVGVNLNSQKSGLSDVLLANIEALGQSENGCYTRPGDNNGDCTTDGTVYFCENSFWFHDCVKNTY